MGAHPDADDLVVRGGLAGEERGSNGRVHPAAHGGNDPAHALATISLEARNRGSTAWNVSSGAIDLGGGRLRAGRDPDRAVGELRLDAHRQQHVARLGAARGAGAARRDLDAIEVERRHEVAALDALDHDTDVVRQPLGLVAGEAHAIDGQQPIAEACAELAKPIRLGRHRGAGEREGSAEPDDPRHVLGPGASLTLLRAAVELRQHVGPLPDEERADALRAAELVRGEADEVRLPGVHVDRRVRGELDGVDVELRGVPAHDLPDLGDRLDRADLVVGGHHADERGRDR